MAPIRPLAWELPYAISAPPPQKKASKAKKKKDLVIGNAVNLYIHIFKISVSYVYIRNGLTHTESPIFLRLLFKKFSVKWG